MDTLYGCTTLSRIPPAPASPTCNIHVTNRPERDMAIKTPALDPETALNVCLQQLEAESPELRRGAAKTLGSFTSKAEAVVPALLESIKDEDSIVRFYVARSLRLLGIKTTPVIEELALRVAADTETAVRLESAYTVAALKVPHPSVIHYLRTLIKEGELCNYTHPEQPQTYRDSGADAIAILGHFGEHASIASGDIAAVIQNSGIGNSQTGYSEAIVTAGKFGTGGSRVVPALLKDLTKKVNRRLRYYKEERISDSRTERMPVIDALTSLGEVALPQTLKLFTTTDNKHLQNDLATVIQQMGSKAKDAIDPLIQVLKERIKSGPDSCFDISKALIAIGEPAFPVLLKHVKDKQSPIRNRAISILGSMAIRPEELLPEYQRILEDEGPAKNKKESSTYHSTIEATANFVRESSEKLPEQLITLIPLLIESTTVQKNIYTRYHFIDVLRLFGSRAVPALITTLEKTLQDGESPFRGWLRSKFFEPRIEQYTTPVGDSTWLPLARRLGAIDERRWKLQINCVEALYCIGKEAAGAKDVLLRIKAQTSNRALSMQVDNALRRIEKS